MKVYCPLTKNECREDCALLIFDSNQHAFICSLATYGVEPGISYLANKITPKDLPTIGGEA